jgi:hypothetical protein
MTLRTRNRKRTKSGTMDITKKGFHGGSGEVILIFFQGFHTENTCAHPWTKT